MTADSVSQWFQKVAELPGHDASGGPPRDVLQRIETALKPFLALSLEAFAELLGKVKKPKAPPKPKKTDAEKLADKQRKAEEVSQLKATKAAEKARDAAEVKRLKAAEADRARAAKAAEKSAEKQRNVDAARLRKEAQDAEATASDQRTAETVARDLHSLIETFDGNAAKSSVEAGIERLKSLNKTQLLLVARHMNADAGLTESSGKPKSMKAVEGRLWRLWKTSQNIRH